MDWVTIATGLGGIITSSATAIGGVVVGGRRARRKDDRLALSARDSLLDRLEREIGRLDGELSDERDRGERCERAHRECQAQTTRLTSRLATLEERLEAVEAATPTPTTERTP